MRGQLCIFYLTAFIEPIRPLFYVIIETQPLHTEILSRPVCENVGGKLQKETKNSVVVQVTTSNCDNDKKAKNDVINYFIFPKTETKSMKQTEKWKK